MHLVLRPTVTDPISLPPPITTGTAEPQIRNNMIPPNFPPSFPPRPHSTPLNPFQGMHGQQQLPGFQHVHQHQVLQPNDINGQAVRLQQMQRETQRLYQDIGMLEQRVRALVPPHLMNAQNPAGQIGVVPGMFQVPQRQAPMPPLPPGFPPFQTFVHQQQRERAAQGLHGAQDLSGGIPPSLSAPGSGRASPSLHRPDHTSTYTREGVGPDGQRWHVTVNQTTTTVPQDIPNQHQHHHHPHMGLPGHFQMGPFGNMQMNPQMNALPNNPVLEIQNILRNADRLNNNMQRNSSNPHPPQTAPAPSTSAAQGSETPTTTANPSASNNSPSASVPLNSNAQAPAAMAGPQLPNEATVYMLSSPSGPQALVVSSSGTFWTPRQSSRHQSATSGNAVGQAGAAVALPEFRNRHAHRARRAQRNQDNAAEPLNAAHANPGAGAVGAGIAQVGPMIWLLVRLAGFVWFFTSGNTTWTRFFLISGLALMLFIAQTGVLNNVFNGIAEELWGPIRRHLEGIMPLAGPDAAMVPAANAAVVAHPNAPAPVPVGEGQTQQADANPGLRRRRRAPEPDPAEAAARILAERRQNPGWLFTQLLRAEHATVLFLASLIPGVGERHIAAREAEATERQRQIEAAAAADTIADDANGVTEGTTESGDNGVNGPAGEETGNNEHAPPAALPVD